MRFCLKSLFVLALLWRAILVDEGRPSDLAAIVADVAPRAQAVAGGEVARQAWASCRRSPELCLADADTLTRFVAAGDDAVRGLSPRTSRP